MITITQDTSQVETLLKQIVGRLDNARPVFAIIGEIVTASVQRNFEEGGRPEPWEPLSPATLKRKKSDMTLVEQGFAGGLLGSIHSTPKRDRAIVGTDKIYAAIHQFGGQAGRGGKVKIPARPFLLVQDEDWAEISAAITDFISTGRA